MLNERLNTLLKNAMKEKDTIGVQVIRLIKTEFLNAEKNQDFNGWTEEKELKILLKMAAQRKDSVKEYLEGGRQDLAESEQKELDYLEQFIPKQPSSEEISEYTKKVIDNLKDNGEALSIRHMQHVLNTVRAKYPTADGKIVAATFKENI